MTYAPTLSTQGVERRMARLRTPAVSRSDAVRLGPIPASSNMVTSDTGFARVPVQRMFAMVREVEEWPEYLPHYRSVRMLEVDPKGGGVVEMTADRPFGSWRWPTTWRALMEVDHARPALRLRHIGGLTSGMEVEWTFADAPLPDHAARGTRITLLHVWRGWPVPVIGPAIARAIIGAVFIQAIAERTIAGLITAAEMHT